MIILYSIIETNITMEYVLRYLTTFIKNDKKERFDMILEPLQSIIQLALISFCPIGSKLSIVNNILQIQIPTWTQGMTRSLNQDKKDDLFFLFSVINRFNKFYSYMKKKGGEYTELYNVLNELCKLGIDRIIQTYSRGGDNHVHLLHTLKMYRTMLENPEFFIERSDEKEKDKGNEKEKGHDKEKGNDKEKEKEKGIEKKEMNDIDSIFIKIRDVYKPEHFKIILNIFKLLQQSPNEFETYIQCLNDLFKPINVSIIKWINEHIIF